MHRIVWLALLASSGCELVADFDRSQIPTNGTDSGVTAPPPVDAGTDASEADASDDDAGDDDAG